jgi:hypothetical protein
MRTLTPEHKAAMQAGRLAGTDSPKKTGRASPLKAIRAKCLDCCGTSDVVKFCTLDGVNSTRCSLWPFRFGKRPESVLRGPNAQFLDPKRMPGADVTQEECVRGGRKTRQDAPVASADNPNSHCAAHGAANVTQTPNPEGE